MTELQKILSLIDANKHSVLSESEILSNITESDILNSKLIMPLFTSIIRFLIKIKKPIAILQQKELVKKIGQSLKGIDESRNVGKFFSKSSRAQSIIQTVAGTVELYMRSIGKPLRDDETDTLISRLSRDIEID